MPALLPRRLLGGNNSSRKDSRRLYRQTGPRGDGPICSRLLLSVALRDAASGYKPQPRSLLSRSDIGQTTRGYPFSYRSIRLLCLHRFTFPRIGARRAAPRSRTVLTEQEGYPEAGKPSGFCQLH